MENKRCTHCGKTKPVDSFRQYYNGRKGYYRYCKTCEQLLTRHKYLKSRGDAATQEQLEELANLERLFEYRRAEGLETPGHGYSQHGTTASLVGQLLAEYEEKTQAN